MSIQRKGLKNKTDFFDILVENTKDYEGKYEEIIKLAPNIYNTICRLLDSKNLSREFRIRLCATIAYFILPYDMYPEAVFGAKGYIDDIFLCLIVLREIEKEYEVEEILEYWDEEPELLHKLLHDDYENLKKDMDKIISKAHKYLGLK